MNYDDLDFDVNPDNIVFKHRCNNKFILLEEKVIKNEETNKENKTKRYNNLFNSFCNDIESIKKQKTYENCVNINIKTENNNKSNNSHSYNSYNNSNNNSNNIYVNINISRNSKVVDDDQNKSDIMNGKSTEYNNNNNNKISEYNNNNNNNNNNYNNNNNNNNNNNSKAKINNVIELSSDEDDFSIAIEDYNLIVYEPHLNIYVIPEATIFIGLLELKSDEKRKLRFSVRKESFVIHSKNCNEITLFYKIVDKIYYCKDAPDSVFYVTILLNFRACLDNREKVWSISVPVGINMLLNPKLDDKNNNISNSGFSSKYILIIFKSKVALDSFVGSVSGINDLKKKITNFQWHPTIGSSHLRAFREKDKIKPKEIRSKIESDFSYQRENGLENKKGIPLCQYPSKRHPKSVAITDIDLKRIDQGDKWFNDNLINARFLKIYDELPREKKAKVYISNTFFLDKLKKGYEQVQTWNKDINIFEYDFLLFPYNINNKHWSLVVISKIMQWVINMNDLTPASTNKEDSNEACFIYMDSMTSLSNANIVFLMLTDYLSHQWKYQNKRKLMKPGVKVEFKKFSKDVWQKGTVISCSSAGSSGNYTIQTFSSSELTFECDNLNLIKIDHSSNLFIDLPRVNSPEVPTQPNCWDCGVYVLKFGESLLTTYPKTAASNRSLNLGDQFNTTMFTHNDIMQLRLIYKKEILQLATEQSEQKEA